MLKLKIFLVATLFVFSTYAVTSASVLSQSLDSGKGFAYLKYLSDEADILLDASEEGDVQFQEALDMEVDYPPLEKAPEPEPEPERYTVSEGDNLYRIALNHNISLESLTSLNDLMGDLIHPGEVLIVSGSEEDIETVETESDTVTAVFVPKSSPTPAPESDVKELLVTATAYTAYCTGCSGTTAYGIDLRSNPNRKVIAVDPKVIPLGTKVWVEGYGEAIAGDTGGAIKGNKIDVFIPSYDNAMAWGVKKVKLKVLN